MPIESPSTLVPGFPCIYIKYHWFHYPASVPLSTPFTLYMDRHYAPTLTFPSMYPWNAKLLPSLSSSSTNPHRAEYLTQRGFQPVLSSVVWGECHCMGLEWRAGQGLITLFSPQRENTMRKPSSRETMHGGWDSWPIYWLESLNFFLTDMWSEIRNFFSITKYDDWYESEKMHLVFYFCFLYFLQSQIYFQLDCLKFVFFTVILFTYSTLGNHITNIYRSND